MNNASMFISCKIRFKRACASLIELKTLGRSAGEPVVLTFADVAQ